MLVVGAVAALCAPAAAFAGGASAPSPSGGTEYGAPVSSSRPVDKRPVAAVFRVTPASLREGTLPRVRLRVRQRGVRRVVARIVAWPLRGSGGRVVRVELGSIATNRLVTVRWPDGTRLPAGRYVVRLHARDAEGDTLARRASASGRAALTVRPAPVPVQSPVAPVTPGGVFPVAGAYSLGGEGSSFGADRGTHSHQGHDISAAEGTPVVAPVAGTIAARDYQADGAGFYYVLAGGDGRHYFFAHCQKDTFTVDEGATVAAGQQLCRVGNTGRSSGPHLHFEIWLGGWRAGKDSHPVDPLPQLQSWARGR